MLQQTRVATVLPYFERWISRFPSAETLATAEDEEIMAHWQGLGYYRRCRRLVDGIRSLNGCAWPKSRIDWQKLPGVGDYTAAALASICNGEKCAVVDGNVERVFARVTACQLSGERRRKSAAAWAGALIPEDGAASWNQAIMELGATLCTPRSPSCDRCPISTSCQAFKAGRVIEFPVANPRPQVTDATQPVVVAVHGDEVGLIRAKEGEWWAGLWRFPFPAEAPRGTDVVIGSVRHTITRYRLTLQVSVRPCDRSPDLRWVSAFGLADVPMPSAMRKVWRLAAEYTPTQCSSA